jgi:DNA-binding NarL/FixJ family response regulator
MDDGPAIKLMFVTDHADMIEGIDPALKRAKGITVVGLATSVPEAQTLAGQHQPDVIVIDLDAYGDAAQDLTQALMHEHPDAQVLMLSVVNDADDVRRAMRAGARDYLTKPLHEGELVETIHWLIGQRREYARMHAFVKQLRRAYEALFTDDKPVPDKVVTFLEQQAADHPHDRLTQETLAVAYARNRDWAKLSPLVARLAETELG